MRLRALYTDPKFVYLALDFCPKGDLFQYLNDFDGDLWELTTRCLWDVASALVYLQEQQIAHRDVKPENILCDRGDTFRLCDFGWAVRFGPDTHHHTTLCGTAEYVPPEMIRVPPVAYHPQHVDSWALGVLAYELIHNTTPFSVSPPRTTSRIFGKIRSFRGFAPKAGGNREYVEFVSGLMEPDPEQRWGPWKALERLEEWRSEDRENMGVTMRRASNPEHRS